MLIALGFAEETPSARQGTNRFNLPPTPAVMTRTEYTRRVHQTNQVLLAEAQQEVESLRTQLSRTQLQSLLKVDQDAHPSNKKAKADTSLTWMVSAGVSVDLLSTTTEAIHASSCGERVGKYMPQIISLSYTYTVYVPHSVTLNYDRS